MKENSMEYFNGIKVGDRIWNVSNGWAIVEEISNIKDDKHPIKVCVLVIQPDGSSVEFKDSVTMEGKSYYKYQNQNWFWDEVKIVPPPKPLPKLERDTRLLVWDKDRGEKRHRYFSHLGESGKVYCYIGGRASWTESVTIPWEHWELPETGES